MAEKVVEVALGDVTVDFFVRRSLSDDRILELALLIEAGVELPPIELNGAWQVIDGRHRLKAYEMLNHATVKAVIRTGLDRGEQVLAALCANMGGSLPPTQADIRLAIQNMLAAGMSSLKIRRGLPLPPSVAARYVSEAQSTMRKAKILAAVQAVTDAEMKVADAAEKFGVEVEDLKDAIRGKKKKVTTDSFGLPKIKSALSTRYRSSSQHNAKMFTGLINGFIDGECTYELVRAALDVTEKMIASQAENVANWRQRLDAAKKNQAA